MPRSCCAREMRPSLPTQGIARCASAKVVRGPSPQLCPASGARMIDFTTLPGLASYREASHDHLILGRPRRCDGGWYCGRDRISLRRRQETSQRRVSASTAELTSVRRGGPGTNLLRRKSRKTVLQNWGVKDPFPVPRPARSKGSARHSGRARQWPGRPAADTPSRGTPSASV